MYRWAATAATTAPDASEELQDIRETATGLYDGFVAALPRLGVALAIVLLGVLLGRGARWALRRRFTRTRSPSFAEVMSRVGGIILVVVSVLVAITVTFPSVQPVDVLASLGFFSIAIGFAFQDILENSLAGILLLFRQPFVGGDQIDLGGQRGTVEGITIRETRIRTPQGHLVVVPNADVYTNNIDVQTNQGYVRTDLAVGIEYDADLERARDLAMDVLTGTDGVLADPAPQVELVGFGASSMDFMVRYWTASRQAQVRATKDRVIQAVKERFDDAGIGFPFQVITLDADESFNRVFSGLRG